MPLPSNLMENRACRRIAVVLVFTVSVIHMITYLPLSKQPSKQLAIAKNDHLKGKITHIKFLKVHKCGSSTMSNIIFRFGLQNNLTFAIPKKGVYIINTDSLLPVRPTGHYDILVSHSIYSRKLYQYSFGTDSVNVAIVRDPVQRMISAAYYYRDVWALGYLLRVPKSNFIENLVRLPHVYDRDPFSFTRNAMGRDFGFSSSISINDTDKIDQHLDMLKKDFKLVLVQERFDESLVLMKRTLNWDIEDILYIKMNTNKHKVESLSSDLIKKLQETCFLDFKVYATFSKIFDEKVKDEGPDFVREVEWFQNVLLSVSEFCHMEQVRNITKIDQSEWNEPFHITQENCSYMKMESRTYLPILRDRHKKMNNKSIDAKHKRVSMQKMQNNKSIDAKHKRVSMQKMQNKKSIDAKHHRVSMQKMQNNKSIDAKHQRVSMQKMQQRKMNY